MPVVTKQQFITNHRKLMKMATNAIMSHDVDKMIINGVKTILITFDPTGSAESGEATSNSFQLPDEDEVKEMLLGMLPAPELILTADMLMRPIYPLIILFETAHLFRIADVPGDYLSSVNLNNDESKKRHIIVYVWLNSFLGFDPSTARSTVDKYKTSRGSSNPLRNGTENIDKDGVILEKIRGVSHVAQGLQSIGVTSSVRLWK